MATKRRSPTRARSTVSSLASGSPAGTASSIRSWNSGTTRTSGSTGEIELNAASMSPDSSDSMIVVAASCRSITLTPADRSRKVATIRGTTSIPSENVCPIRNGTSSPPAAASTSSTASDLDRSSLAACPASTQPACRSRSRRPSRSTSTTPSLSSSARIERWMLATLRPRCRAAWPRCSPDENASRISRS
jgi:hypothetical protein